MKKNPLFKCQYLLLALFCLFFFQSASAQMVGGVFQYSNELEGHHCDNGGCYGYCTNSYMENSTSANFSFPSTTLSYNVKNWMGKLLQIKPNIKINEISIPGTHDSGAQWGGHTAETQSWDIFQQLDGGIRYFDIRLKPNPDDPNGLAVYHGDFPQGYDPNCYGAVGVTCDRLTLTQILTWMKNFLENNKDEAILMRILYEVSPTDSDPTDAQKTEFSNRLTKILFKETNGRGGIQINGDNSDTQVFPIYNIKTEGQYNYGTTIPTLSDLRGKIWIDRVKGADDNTTPIHQFSPTNDRVIVQNNYTASASNLGDAVVAAIKEAPTHISKGSWVQNWINGINLTLPAVPVPNDVASWVNKRTFHALNELGSNRPLGTIIMDFPGEGLIYRIIKTNFAYNKKVDLTVAIDCNFNWIVGGATSNNITVTLYNGSEVIGTKTQVPGCNGLGDSFWQFEKVMRAMPQDFTHFSVKTDNANKNDGFGVDEIYISYTRYGLNCYDGGVEDDQIEKWGVDGGLLWCIGDEKSNEFGGYAHGCNQSVTFVSGMGAYRGFNVLPDPLRTERNVFINNNTPLEYQAYSVAGTAVTVPFPIAICKNIILELDVNGKASIDTYQIDNGSYTPGHPNLLLNMSLDKYDFSCENIEVNTVQLTIDNGRTATCTSTVTVVDNIPPQVITKNITVYLDQMGKISIIPSQVDNGSNDACGIKSLTLSPSMFDCSKIGDNTVVLTVTDTNNNTATNTAIVTVLDNIPPVLTVISDPIVLWSPDHKYQKIDVSELVLSVTDNCTILTSDDVYITNVTSDEAEDSNGSGDGNTLNDIAINSTCHSLELRKERNGNGNGRVYTIHLKVDDGNGNSDTASCKVFVPHNKNSTVVDDGVAYQKICGNDYIVSVNDLQNSTYKTLSVNDTKEANNSIILYPNPANDFVYLTLNSNNETDLIKINIADVNGKILYSKSELANQKFKINISTYSTGYYFVTISQGNLTQSIKLIKE